jgi:hypothetical protein
MAKGGYRKPANPAPVSGPGSLSRRTDGGPIQGAKEIPGGGKYGERKALADIQSGAPMQGNPVPNVPAVSNMQPRTTQPVTNLFAPTENPDEPVTAGAPMGLGRNPEPATQYGMIQKYMPQLESLASKEDAPESFKIFLGLVKSSINEGA